MPFFQQPFPANMLGAQAWPGIASDTQAVTASGSASGASFRPMLMQLPHQSVPMHVPTGMSLLGPTPARTFPMPAPTGTSMSATLSQHSVPMLTPQPEAHQSVSMYWHQHDHVPHQSVPVTAPMSISRTPHPIDSTLSMPAGMRALVPAPVHMPAIPGPPYADVQHHGLHLSWGPYIHQPRPHWQPTQSFSMPHDSPAQADRLLAHAAAHALPSPQRNVEFPLFHALPLAAPTPQAASVYDVHVSSPIHGHGDAVPLAVPVLEAVGATAHWHHGQHHGGGASHNHVPESAGNNFK